MNELRVAGVRTLTTANTYLRDRFVAEYNDTFGVAPCDPESAFVPVGAVDLESIFCHQEERTVGRDNTVVLEGVRLQIAKQPGRRSCSGLRVLVRRNLQGRHSVWMGTRCLGRYDAMGRPEAPGRAA